MTITAPLTTEHRLMLQRDGFLKILHVLDGYLHPDEQVWQITTPIELNDREQTISVTATTMRNLLEWRHVAFDEGTPQADKSGAIDTLLFNYITENAGASASVARRWTTMTFQSVAGTAPSTTYSAARQTLADVVQRLSAISLNQGIYLAVDIVGIPTNLTCSIYRDQRGADRRSLDIGQCVTNIVVTDDWSDEANMLIAGGAGEGAARLFGIVQHTQRQTRGRYSYREQFVNATNATTQAQVNAEAQSAAARTRPRLRLDAQFQETSTLRFGRELQFGDRVRASAYGMTFDCRLDAVTLGEQADGTPIIDVKVLGETYAD